MKTAILIHNPTSRSTLSLAALDGVRRCAEAGGWRMTLVSTERAGHATSLARDAAERGVDVVVVNGGDGTINETVNGLAHSATALAVLPGGTANVWAKETRTSKDPLVAMQGILNGELRRVDLGRAGERYFLLMAGVGLDGEIIRNVGVRLKRRFGALSYIFAGVPAALRTKPWKVRMVVDGVEAETDVYWMVIGNTRSYGGFKDITHRAIADDGKLDVAIMRRGGILHLLVDGVRLLRGRHERSPNIRYLRVERLNLETAFVPVQLDGELHDNTPMQFEAVPRALSVIVPAGFRSPLLEQAAPSAGIGER